MRPLSRGFSLVEQLTVLSVVGTVTATALPAMLGLQAQASDAALSSLAGAAGSAMELNQAGCLVNNQRVVPGSCERVRNCSDVANLLVGAVPAGYQVPAQPLKGRDGRCQLLRLKDGASASFHGVAAGG